MGRSELHSLRVCLPLAHVCSCSTTWYSMAYVESCNGGVSKGQKILQLGVGGGMKAGINVWRALRDVHVRHSVWDHVADNPFTGTILCGTLSLLLLAGYHIEVLSGLCASAIHTCT